MIKDIQYSFRVLKSHPWYSLAIIVTLALGIGINSTVFTLTNAVLFKDLTVTNGDRIVIVANTDLNNPDRTHGTSYLDYLDYKEQNSSVEVLAGRRGDTMTIGDSSGHAEQVDVSIITPNLFEIVDARPVMGRSFNEQDSLPGAANVVLISHKLWQDRYLGDPDIVGKTIRLNRIPSTIVGVMPEGTRFPDGDDIWAPLVPTDEQLENRARRDIRLIALMKPGYSINDVSGDLAVIAHRNAEAFPDANTDFSVVAKTFHQYFNGGEIRILFFVMMGAVGFVLLIACSNVANMMLSKAMSRKFEFSIRASMGATRWQMIRLLLTESVTLSLLGGLLGLGITLLGVSIFDQATMNVGRPYWIEFTPDFAVFGYIAAVSIFSGILFGLMPALRATRNNLNSSLKEGTRTSGSKGTGKLTGILVAFQFAMTLALLCAAGLLIQSFIGTQTLNSFVPEEEIFGVRTYLPVAPGDPYEEEHERARFYNEAVEKLKSIPGVTHAVATSNLPGMGGGRRRIEIDGRPVIDEADAPQVGVSGHTPGYLAAVNLPILEGRDFNEFDGKDGNLVAIITRELANTHWPDGSAIGKRFRTFRDTEKWYTVVGVCGNINQNPGSDNPLPFMFMPYNQQNWANMALMIRSELDPTTLAGMVRSVIEGLDPDLPLFDVGTLRASIERQFWFLRVFGTVFLVFAIVSLAMASVGIYAVVSNSVIQKSKEIGIRLALGATSEKVVRLVFAKGSIQLIVGLALGLLVAYGTTPLMPSAILFNISPHDPLVFTSVPLLLLSVGLFACWLPARQVAKKQPGAVLHRD